MDLDDGMAREAQAHPDADQAPAFMDDQADQAVHVPLQPAAPEPKPLPVPERLASEVDQHGAHAQ